MRTRGGDNTGAAAGGPPNPGKAALVAEPNGSRSKSNHDRWQLDEPGCAEVRPTTAEVMPGRVREPCRLGAPFWTRPLILDASFCASAASGFSGGGGHA
jgi:hypothetical protein